ncbi:MAG: hypothetical protein AABN95_03675 [Acidobacteriota bacterium]
MIDERNIGIPIDEEGTSVLHEEDFEILRSVERTLADGVALKRWFDATEASDGFAERFEVVQEFNRSDESFGFYDRINLGGERVIPVMGTVDDSTFDRPKQATSNLVRDEFREFLLRYFMRVSDYRQPQAYLTDEEERATAGYGKGISWCTRREPTDTGFGFSQHYYKLRETGEVGKFHRREHWTIVDLREIGTRYEWIVLKVRIFNFNMTFRVLGSDQAKLVIPLIEESYLVLSADFVLNETDPEPGVLGRYGFGYAFVRNESAGLLAYGPGEFDAAIELIQFHVLASGETRAHLVFVVNRPDRIVNATLDPVALGFGAADLMSLGVASTLFGPIRAALERLPIRIGPFDPISTYVALANQLTGGLAAQELCISREQLEKDFLVQHFQQHYQMLTGALLTWRRIPDWLNPEELPKSIITGRNV